jgi:hypothetical protein
VRVKYIIIDHRKPFFGTYARKTYEEDMDMEGLDVDPSDLGSVGKVIHDELYGEGEKRHFVKVLGAEP